MSDKSKSRINLPPFPPVRVVDYPLYSLETLAKDREQKRVAQSTRVALADWFMAISEPATEGQP